MGSTWQPGSIRPPAETEKLPALPGEAETEKLPALPGETEKLPPLLRGGAGEMTTDPSGPGEAAMTTGAGCLKDICGDPCVKTLDTKRGEPATTGAVEKTGTGWAGKVA